MMMIFLNKKVPKYTEKFPNAIRQKEMIFVVSNLQEELKYVGNNFLYSLNLLSI
jgi:hypothetical protein